MKYLLDTNIISEPMKLKVNSGVMKRIELDGLFSCTSATVWHELWHGVRLLSDGARKKELESYLNLLVKDDFRILPFCKNAAEWLAQERVKLKTQGIIPAKYDSEIAAVAYVNKLTIVTRNVDDFLIFEDLSVENWFVD